MGDRTRPGYGPEKKGGTDVKKRNLVKKMTALVLTGTMMAPLAACGGGQGAAAGGGTSGGTENTVKAAEGADTAAPCGEKTKITYCAPF